MDWIQFIIFFIGVFGLFLWNRAESRADIRALSDESKSELRALNTYINATNGAIIAIKDEMRDFHGRLCALEEKYYQWLMRKEK